MPRLVRVIVHETATDAQMQEVLARNVADGTRRWNESNRMTVITMPGGRWKWRLFLKAVRGR